MTRILVLGAGVMGTAITLPMAESGADVRLVGTHLDREIVASMRTARLHPRLKAPIHEKVEPFDDGEMAAAFSAPPDLLVVGVSTPGIHWAGECLAAHLTGDCPVVLLTKGIEAGPDGIVALPEVIARYLAGAGKHHGPIGGIGGPCIAGELAVGRETSSVLGFDDRALAQSWASMITTPYYQLRTTDDVRGLEICAALKNFFAIGVGTAAGSAPRRPAVNGAAVHNATASLFTQAVRELDIIVRASGGRAETVHGLAGTGDLHVTCQAGRNSRLGHLMGDGMSYSAAMNGPLSGETVEGTLVAFALADALVALEAKGAISAMDLPLTRGIIAAVTGDKPFEADWAAFHRGRAA